MSKAEISGKQSGEWEEFRRDVLNPLYSSCKEGELKDAKLLADVIKICHEGERKAFDYGQGLSQDQAIEISFED